MRFIALLLLGIFTFGCTQSGSVGYGGNITAGQLKPFLDAGCTNRSAGYLECQNATFNFNCDPATARMVPAGAGLEPPLPMLECDAGVLDNNLTDAQMEGYFYCGGNMIKRCTSYVAWDGSRFVRINNATELAAMVAPIASEAEAMDFVLLSEDVLDSLHYEVYRAPGDMTVKAEKNAGGFLVTAYAANASGCYDKIDYERVQFEVSADGKIEEKSRQLAFTDNLGLTMCVD